MQFELPFGPSRRRAAATSEEWLRVGARQLRLRLIPNRGARRYVLRLNRDGTARVTVPRGGSAAEARRFAEKNVPWLEKQLVRQALQPSRPKTWESGTLIWFRGECVHLESGSNGETSIIRFGAEALRVKDPTADLRPEVERYLWRLAARELPARTRELAALHGIAIQRVAVRNQRSRWGSCSRRGTISLNWRLIQAPPFVRDYILLHELAHVKEMNHSRRFWRGVALLCPGFKEAERWLKQHADLLM